MGRDRVESRQIVLARSLTRSADYESVPRSLQLPRAHCEQRRPKPHRGGDEPIAQRFGHIRHDEARVDSSHSKKAPNGTSLSRRIVHGATQRLVDVF